MSNTLINILFEQYDLYSFASFTAALIVSLRICLWVCPSVCLSAVFQNASSLAVLVGIS